MQFTIEDVIAEGDKVVVRWTNAGTDSGGFLGMPATGRDFGIAGIDIHVVRDGKRQRGLDTARPHEGDGWHTLSV